MSTVHLETLAWPTVPHHAALLSHTDFEAIDTLLGLKHSSGDDSDSTNSGTEAKHSSSSAAYSLKRRASRVQRCCNSRPPVSRKRARNRSDRSDHNHADTSPKPELKSNIATACAGPSLEAAAVHVQAFQARDLTDTSSSAPVAAKPIYSVPVPASSPSSASAHRAKRLKKLRVRHSVASISPTELMKSRMRIWAQNIQHMQQRHLFAMKQQQQLQQRQQQMQQFHGRKLQSQPTSSQLLLFSRNSMTLPMVASN